MARRNNGEGTIYRRKDGRYEASAYVVTTTGERKRIRLYARTRKEAQEALILAQAKEAQGIPVSSKTWKLRDYFDYWLEYGVQSKRRPMTYKRHEGIVRLYLKPGLGQYTLNQLSVMIVQEFLDRLAAVGQSPANIYQIRKVLSAALTYAMRRELVMRNVARLVELPIYKPDEAEHWTPDETIRFLDVAKDERSYPEFVLLVLYGLRLGEVLGLRWCDVDFDQGILRIRQQLQLIKGELLQVPLKTASSRRDEPLLTEARSILSTHRIGQEAARSKVGSEWAGSGSDEELVFTTRTGTPIDPRNLYRSFIRICKEHGLRRITVHGLRHTNATTQKDLKVPGRDIQAVLGHGNLQTTLIYEHVDLDRKRNALEKVEERLFGEEAKGSLRGRCRQLLPSNGYFNSIFLNNLVPVTSGGPSGTRTHDTRLKRAGESTIPTSLTEVKLAAKGRYSAWLLGGVAVMIAVRNMHSCSSEIAAVALVGSGFSIPVRTVMSPMQHVRLGLLEARRAEGAGHGTSS